MKHFFLSMMLLSALLSVSCKQNKSQSEQETATTSPSTTDAPADKKTESSPKTFTVTATPDSATLGKSAQAFIKIKNIKAIQLSTPDQADAGIQLSYDLEVTNKQAVGGSSVYINPDNFRLVLNNGNKLTQDTYNTVSVDADATGTSSDNIFKLPAGTKPVSLNLFFDDTQVSVKMEIK